ncbi:MULTISPECIES: hypothetical protein [unclassified Pseudonocardia]|uniref:hypothetical protein n=1 Tax=unclassified Pseudonocardia TaxID=2619320 RepID=UPI000AC40EFD|nr:hypothetical protein [Pseudonocardia sp. Ae707_Ps1]
MIVVLAGCSGDAEPSAAEGGSDRPSKAAPQAFDPPTDFGAPVAFMTRRDDAQVPSVRVLDGLAGWTVGSGGLVRVDFPANVVGPGVFPDNALDPTVDLDRGSGITSEQIGNPVVAATPVGRLAVAAFPVEIAGRGTTPGGPAIELVGADSATGAKTLSATVPLPAGSSPGFDPLVHYVGVVGVEGSTAVVTATTSEGGFTAAVDLGTGETMWTAPDLTGRQVVDGTVIVYRHDFASPEMRGLSLTDGAQRWAGGPSGKAFPIGERLVLVSDNTGTAVLEAATGARVTTTPLGEDQKSWRCYYDQRSITVCQLDQFGKPYAVVGLDESGAELWRIVARSGGDRVPPTVTATWHGAVYGHTPDGGPVVLDGQTGADRTPAAAAAPLLVNEYFGIAPAPAEPGKVPDYRWYSELAAFPSTA